MRTFTQFVADEKKRRGVTSLSEIPEGERTRFYTPSGDIPSVDVEAMGPNLQRLVNDFGEIFSECPAHAGHVDNIRYYAPIINAARQDIQAQLQDYQSELPNQKDMNDFIDGYFFAAISIAEKKHMRENPELAKQVGSEKQKQLTFLKGILAAVGANPIKDQTHENWDYDELQRVTKEVIGSGGKYKSKVTGLHSDLMMYASDHNTSSIIGAIAKFAGDGLVSALGPEGLNEVLVSQCKLVQDQLEKEGKVIPEIISRVVNRNGYQFSKADEQLLIDQLKENPNAFQLNMLLSIAEPETIADMFNQVAIHYLPSDDLAKATPEQVLQTTAFLEKNQLFMHNSMAEKRPGQASQIVLTAALSSIYAKNADTQLERIMKTLGTAQEQAELYEKLMLHVNNNANFEHKHKRWDKLAKKDKTDTQKQALKALEALKPKLDARVEAEKQKQAQAGSEAAKTAASTTDVTATDKENHKPNAVGTESRAARWSAERSESPSRSQFIIGAGRGGAQKRSSDTLRQSAPTKAARSGNTLGRGRGRIERGKRVGRMIRTSSQEDLLKMNRQELQDFLALQRAIEKKEYPSRRSDIQKVIDNIKDVIQESYFKEPHTEAEMKRILSSSSKEEMDNLKEKLVDFEERATKEGNTKLAEAHQQNITLVEEKLESVIKHDKDSQSNPRSGA